MITVANAVSKLPSIVAAIPSSGMIEGEVVLPSLSKITTNLASSSNALPPFIAMPQSSAKLTNRISNSGTLLQDSDNEIVHENYQVIAFNTIKRY